MESYGLPDPQSGDEILAEDYRTLRDAIGIQMSGPNVMQTQFGYHDAGEVVRENPTRIGKLDEALSQGGSATVSVWSGDGGSEADTGRNIVAYDWLMETGADVRPTTQHVYPTPV